MIARLGLAAGIAGAASAAGAGDLPAVVAFLAGAAVVTALARRARA